MKGIVSNYTSAALHDDETPAAWRVPAHAFRARVFWQALSPARRAAIARRRRFYTIAFIRPANKPDPDDFLP